MVALTPRPPVVEAQDFTHYPALFLEGLGRFAEDSCSGRVV